MNERVTRRGFAARPGDAESWIKASDAPPPSRWVRLHIKRSPSPHD